MLGLIVPENTPKIIPCQLVSYHDRAEYYSFQNMLYKMPYSQIVEEKDNLGAYLYFPKTLFRLNFSRFLSFIEPLFSLIQGYGP
jgi:hypothetical protein